MSWIENRIKKFKMKSPLQKAYDIGFLLLILLFIIPDGRIFMQRMLLQTGFFNADVELENRIVIPQEDFKQVVFIGADNKQHILEEFKGQVVFLNYWATWCPPCKAEIPSLSNLYGNYKNNKGINFFFMTFEKHEKVNSFLKEYESIMPPSFMVQNAPVSLKADALPKTIIIDKEGRIAYKHAGMAKWDTDDIYQQLDELINE